MVLRSVHRLDKSIAPSFISVLYWIAIVGIGIGVLFGVAGGVRIMIRPMAPMTSVNGAAGSAADANAANGPSRDDLKSGGSVYERRDFEFRRHRGYGFHRHRQPGWIRDLPPQARGGVLILFSLLRGVIALLIVRILAEIGLSILAMGAKSKQAA